MLSAIVARHRPRPRVRRCARTCSPRSSPPTIATACSAPTASTATATRRCDRYGVYRVSRRAVGVLARRCRARVGRLVRAGRLGPSAGGGLATSHRPGAQRSCSLGLLVSAVRRWRPAGVGRAAAALTARRDAGGGSHGRHVFEPAAPRTRRPPAAARWSTASGSRSSRRAAEPAGSRSNYTSLDDSTAAAGRWDPRRTAANARRAATDPRAVYYIGEFDSGASGDLDSDPQPGGDRTGQPDQHLRRSDHGAAGQPRAASRRSTTRRAGAPTCGSCRSTRCRQPPTCSRPSRAGCAKVALAHDDGVDGAGPGEDARAGEAALWGEDRQRHRDRVHGDQLARLRRHDQGRSEPIASCSREPSHALRCRSPRTSTPRCRRPGSSVQTGSAPRPTPRSPRAASPPRIDPLIQCTAATPNLSASPGGRAF